MVNRLRIDGSLLATPAAVDAPARVAARLETDRNRPRPRPRPRPCRTWLLDHRAGGGTNWGTATSRGTRHPRIRRRRRIPPAHSLLRPLEPLLDGPLSERENEEHHETENWNEPGQHVPTRVAGFGDDLHLTHQRKYGDRDGDHDEDYKHARDSSGHGNAVELSRLRGARGAVDASQCQQRCRDT
jgi:hypothetical protein